MRPLLAIKLAGYAVGINWSSLSQKLLQTHDIDPEVQCPQIDPSSLEPLANELRQAENQFKIRARLAKYIPEWGATQNETPEEMLHKLQESAALLESHCKMFQNSKPDLTPEWSEDQNILKSQALKFVFDNLFYQFDQEGYSAMLKMAFRDPSVEVRFQQTIRQIESHLPHCDGGASPPSLNLDFLRGFGSAAFPGGPFRLDFGFDLSKWLTQQLISAVESAMTSAAASTSGPISQMMAMMAVSTVLSVIETVVAIIIDIVPPMIPPPFWILWSLPCLPMLTGPNCIFSVLYPVSLSDFLMAPTTDGIMSGVLTNYPSKYAQKVGKTSDAAYIACGVAYLGMFCASLFPLCWIPMGVREAMTFPMCFLHCIVTLLACPGFWIDDIIGPCLNISVPPLCSFSAYLNIGKIPPQFVSFEDSHPYPNTCPVYDPNYDAPLPLPTLASPAAVKTTTSKPTTIPIELPSGSGPSVMGNIDDYANIAQPVQLVCDCRHPCTLLGNCTAVEVPESCREACKQHSLNEAIQSEKPNREMLRPSVPNHTLPFGFAGHIIPVVTSL